MRYLVIVEKCLSGLGAYIPDLPGCVAAAATRKEVVKLIQNAIELHVEDLREQRGNRFLGPPQRSSL